MKSFFLEVTFLEFFSGKFGRIQAKVLRTSYNLPAPTPMPATISWCKVSNGVCLTHLVLFILCYLRHVNFFIMFCYIFYTRPFILYKTRKRLYIFLDYFIHTSPAYRARKVFKPSKDAERLLVSIKKSWEVLDLSFLWVTS